MGEVQEKARKYSQSVRKYKHPLQEVIQDTELESENEHDATEKHSDTESESENEHDSTEKHSDTESETETEDRNEPTCAPQPLSSRFPTGMQNIQIQVIANCV